MPQTPGNTLPVQDTSGELQITDPVPRTEFQYDANGSPLNAPTINTAYTNKWTPDATLRFSTEFSRNGYGNAEPSVVTFKDESGASYTVALNVVEPNGKTMQHYLLYDQNPRDPNPSKPLSLFALGNHMPDTVTLGKPLVFPGGDTLTTGNITQMTIPKATGAIDDGTEVQPRPGQQNPLSGRREQIERLAGERYKNLDGNGNILPEPISRPELLKGTRYSGQVAGTAPIDKDKGLPKKIYADSELRVIEQVFLARGVGVNLGNALRGGVALRMILREPDGKRSEVTVSQTPPDKDPQRGEYLWSTYPVGPDKQVLTEVGPPADTYFDHRSLDNFCAAAGGTFQLATEAHDGSSITLTDSVPRNPNYSADVQPLIPPGTMVETLQLFR